MVSPQREVTLNMALFIYGGFEITVEVIDKTFSRR
jgi:hypothetical protein